MPVERIRPNLGKEGSAYVKVADAEYYLKWERVSAYEYPVWTRRLDDGSRCWVVLESNVWRFESLGRDRSHIRIPMKECETKSVYFAD